MYKQATTEVEVRYSVELVTRPLMTIYNSLCGAPLAVGLLGEPNVYRSDNTAARMN